MTAAEVTLQKIDGIYDIQPLFRPAYSTLETIVLVLLLTSAVIVSAYYIWKFLFSRKAITKRKILALQLKYSKNSIDAHDCIYQLCYLIQHGLKLKQLGIKTPLPEKLASKKDEWNSFISTLSNLRYAKNNNTKKLNALFGDSLYWLKTLP